MKHDAASNNRPKVGTTFGCLGARIPRDIQPDVEAHVNRCKKGLSVAPSLEDIGVFMVPKKYAHLLEGAKGEDALSVWVFSGKEFKDTAIAPKLYLECTSTTHGVIGPSERMHVDLYQRALADTQDKWEILDES